jgi:2-hydroxy-3-oxopropionate reductase
MTVRRIGFIGLGAMGQPMARCLLRQGFEVKSSANRRREAIEALVPDGLIEVGSPREVAAAADAVIVMVRDGVETDTVLDGDDGVLAGMAPGSTLVLMSTLAPGYCVERAERMAARGIGLLDAPVSGLPERAESGTLAIMVGGEVDGIERLCPAFEAMGTVYPCGDVGMGMVAKLANNLIAVGTVALVGEAVELADSLGMEPSTLLQILSASSGDSFMVRNWDMIRRVWPDTKDLAVKDLSLCMAAAADHGLALPLGDAVSRYPWDREL